VRSAVYGQAADVWALGAITFSMMTGEKLIDLECLQGETAEFKRLLNGNDLLDDLAKRVRSEAFMQQRLRLVGRRGGDEQAADLLGQMLQIDPEKRITASQALSHPYVAQSFVRNPETTAANLGAVRAEIGSTLERIRCFVELPGLRKLAILAAAHLLGPQDSHEIRSAYLAFRLIGREGDGLLKRHEIEAALLRSGYDVPDDTAQLFSFVDVHHNGGINLVEWVAATMDPSIYAEQRMCRAVFRLLDADHDGQISVSDLERLLHENDATQRTQRARALLTSAGGRRGSLLGGEPSVGWERFEAMMRE